MEQTTVQEAWWQEMWINVQPFVFELSIAVIFTIAATHFIKLIVPKYKPHVAESKTEWAAFCATASLIVGTFTGLGLWIATDLDWYIIPLMSVVPGLSWRILRGMVPRNISNSLVTPNDKKFSVHKDES